MMARKPSQKLTRHTLDKSAKAKELLDELVHVGAGAELIDYIGWRDAEGNIRRARAVFDNGWTAEMRFGSPRGGKQSFSYRVHWRSTIKGKAA